MPVQNNIVIPTISKQWLASWIFSINNVYFGFPQPVMILLDINFIFDTFHMIWEKKIMGFNFTFKSQDLPQGALSFYRDQK